MDDASIQAIVAEIAPLLHNRAAGKIFQLTPTSLAIDLGTRDAGYLFFSVEPAMPRLYLIKRTVKELEKQSRPLTPFALSLRKELTNSRLSSIEKEPNDRIVRLTFTGRDDFGAMHARMLIAQLTGRSANLLLLDEQNVIIQTLRSSPGMQPIGSSYERSPPPSPLRNKPASKLYELISRADAAPSVTADQYFARQLAEKDQAARIASARADLRKKISQQEKLLMKLENDRRAHENPDQHKRTGDLLLANLSSAQRQGSRVTLIDYFANDAPQFEIELDAAVSLQEEATRRFGLYAKAKRAIEQIESRLRETRSRLRQLEDERTSLEKRIGEGDLAKLAPRPQSTSASTRKKEPSRVPGTRRYLSSDEFEILVGRSAQDNDHLTFKIARPNDIWLHAADYGGSHVVVRNSTRKEIPQRTLIEAAQLAAYFSQAKKSPKADVHYTERKFVAKIKGGKPGLVRLQRFRTMTVVPNESGTRST
jgi:predicted ribosome quality control (RQC) complex YloA/Tae2 family protein